MKYQTIGDAMWYSGHVLTGLAVFGNQYNYFLAVALVVVGQLLTIASRPISRLVPNNEKEPELNIV